VEEIINKANENIKKGVAIATGIGVFAAISDKKRILLRRRAEKGSLIYSKDLSGKWELPGGGMELRDFGEEYQSSFKNTLEREIKEETGLDAVLDSQKIVLLPAVLKRSSIEKLGLIDFAFVIPVPVAITGEATNKYRRKIAKGEIQWIPIGEMEKIQIVSERMKYLIAIAIDYMKQHW
jgi:8-oxo-dGTP pyrophosphatase MutT (NUDIX family)